jgi:RHS repeat-associated protein
LANDQACQGQAFSDVGNPFGFQGRRHFALDTGPWETDGRLMLIDFRNRFSDPVTGRWLTRDPIGYGAGTMNLFEQVFSNPIKWWDPWGLQSCKPNHSVLDTSSLQEAVLTPPHKKAETLVKAVVGIVKRIVNAIKKLPAEKDMFIAAGRSKADAYFSTAADALMRFFGFESLLYDSWQAFDRDGNPLTTKDHVLNAVGGAVNVALSITGGGKLILGGVRVLVGKTVTGETVGLIIGDSKASVTALAGGEKNVVELVIDGRKVYVAKGSVGPGGEFVPDSVKGMAEAGPNVPGPNTRVHALPETTAPEPVRPEDAVGQWEEFLGDEPYTDIHPRTGVRDPNRLVSQGGTRSIRFGQHEMNSPPGRFHYHEETWTYDPFTNTMIVRNRIIRVPQPR